MYILEGKTAIVTGGNSGIGFSAAKLFLSHGAKVIITGRNKEAIEKAASELGSNAFGIVSDAGDMQHLTTLPGKVSEITQKIDILFVNAGVGLFVPFDQTTEEVFDANVDINFKGAFFTIQKLLPMITSGASIILNSTILLHCGYPGASAYSASKAAVLSLCKTLAVELVDRNIRVNSISPGPINTPIYDKMGIPPDVMQEFAAGVQAKIPMQRFGAPEEVANAALFLASDESSFMTGSEITVDGGKRITF